MIVESSDAPSGTGLMSARFAQRTADTVRWVDQQRGLTTPSPPQRSQYPILQQGLLLQDVCYGEEARVILSDYNPLQRSYKIDQVGLWNPLTPSFRLKLKSGTQILLDRTFTDPTADELYQWLKNFRPTIFGGNPFRRNGAFSPVLINSVTNASKINYGFWIISLPVQLSLEFTNLSPGTSQTVVMSPFSGTLASLGTCFDAMNLEWPLCRGSWVTLGDFKRGLGIVAANAKQFWE